MKSYFIVLVLFLVAFVFVSFDSKESHEDASKIIMVGESHFSNDKNESNGYFIEAKSTNHELQKSEVASSTNTENRVLNEIVYSEKSLLELGLTVELLKQIEDKVASEGESFKFESHHWIELLGYDNNGEPVFEIVSLVDFSERALKTVGKAFNYELDRFQFDESWGDFDPANEEALIKIIENGLGDERSSQLNVVNCRQFKCMASLTLGEGDVDAGFSSLHSEVRKHFKAQNDEELICNYLQEPGYKKNYYLTYFCKPKIQVKS